MIQILSGNASVVAGVAEPAGHQSGCGGKGSGVSLGAPCDQDDLVAEAARRCLDQLLVSQDAELARQSALQQRPNARQSAAHAWLTV